MWFIALLPIGMAIEIILRRFHYPTKESIEHLNGKISKKSIINLV